MVSDSVDLITAMLALYVVARMTTRMDGAGAAPTGVWNAPERPLGSPAGAVSE